MKYQITTSGKEKYLITEDEAKNIAKGDIKGLVFVPSVKGYINLSFVVSVIPEDRIDRSTLTEGFLHDGTRVIKRFGEWKDPSCPNANLDFMHYPEIVNDTVMSETEYLEKKDNKLLN